MNVTYLRPGDAAAPVPPPAARIRLLPAGRLRVEQARAALTELPDQATAADLPRAMYLLGVLAGHAQSLLDVVDTITEVS